MKKKVFVLVFIIEILIIVSLLVFSMVEIGRTVNGINYIKATPKIYGSNPDLSGNYKLLKEYIARMILCFLAVAGAVLMFVFHKRLMASKGE